MRRPGNAATGAFVGYSASAEAAAVGESMKKREHDTDPSSPPIPEPNEGEPAKPAPRLVALPSAGQYASPVIHGRENDSVDDYFRAWMKKPSAPPRAVARRLPDDDLDDEESPSGTVPSDRPSLEPTEPGIGPSVPKGSRRSRAGIVALGVALLAAAAGTVVAVATCGMQRVSEAHVHPTRSAAHSSLAPPQGSASAPSPVAARSDPAPAGVPLAPATSATSNETPVGSRSPIKHGRPPSALDPKAPLPPPPTTSTTPPLPAAPPPTPPSASTTAPVRDFDLLIRRDRP